MSIGDSLYKGTGFYDITAAEPHPVITPQVGIAFVNLFLLYSGFHDPANRFLAIKIINYLGFLCLIFVFYRIFNKLKVSETITVLCLGIVLVSAYFANTIMAPVNEGWYCFLTALILYLIIINDAKNSYLIFGAIAVLSILLVMFKINGPLIVISATIAYLLRRDLRKATIYFIIFIISYASLFALLELLRVDLGVTKLVVAGAYPKGFITNKDYLVNKIVMILIYTIPGVFLGISGKKMLITLPMSLAIISFYVFYFKQSVKDKSFLKLCIIIYIISTILFLFIPLGHDSRYIITIIPFSLVAIATYFKDNVRFRIILWIVLLFTLSITSYRLIFWDSVFFKNKLPYEYVQKNIVEPYNLISQSSRYSYYIFNKRSISIKNVVKGDGPFIVFGNNKYINDIINTINMKFNIKRVERIDSQFIMAHRDDEIYHIVKIIIN